jgi:hypothetical protein
MRSEANFYRRSPRRNICQWHRNTNSVISSPVAQKHKHKHKQQSQTVLYHRQWHRTPVRVRQVEQVLQVLQVHVQPPA